MVVKFRDYLYNFSFSGSACATMQSIGAAGVGIKGAMAGAAAGAAVANTAEEKRKKKRGN